MNLYVRAALIALIALVTTKEQISAMAIAKECKKPQKQVEALPTIRAQVNRVLLSVETMFKNKKAEKNAVILCNVDSIVWTKTIPPMAMALKALLPFFTAKGYTIVFVTTGAESIRNFITDLLAKKGYDTKTCDLICMPNNVNALKFNYKTMEEVSQKQQDNINAKFMWAVRSHLIKRDHAITASIDVEPALLKGKNVGYPILMPKDAQ